jgi:hypothetical protein
MSAPTDAEDVARKALGSHIVAESRRDKAAESLVAALTEAGHLYENGWVEAVEVHNSAVPVETRHEYGLTIRLDAGGNAVSVSSPYGFMIIEESDQ